jgi:hypothetical protein
LELPTRELERYQSKEALNRVNSGHGLHKVPPNKNGEILNRSVLLRGILLVRTGTDIVKSAALGPSPMDCILPMRQTRIWRDPHARLPDAL